MKMRIVKIFKKITLQNALLIIITLTLVSILWTLNKGLREFVYHTEYIGLRFHNIDTHDRIDELGTAPYIVYMHLPQTLSDTGKRSDNIACLKKIYVFNLKLNINDKIDSKSLPFNERKTCPRNEYWENGYWIPEHIQWKVGLNNDIFFETPYKKLSFDELMEYTKTNDKGMYEMVRSAIEINEKLKK